MQKAFLSSCCFATILTTEALAINMYVSSDQTTQKHGHPHLVVCGWIHMETLVRQERCCCGRNK